MAGPSVGGSPREQEMRVEAPADDRRSGWSGHKEDRAQRKIHHNSDDQPWMAVSHWQHRVGVCHAVVRGICPHEQHEQHADDEVA